MQLKGRVHHSDATLRRLEIADGDGVVRHAAGVEGTRRDGLWQIKAAEGSRVPAVLAACSHGSSSLTSELQESAAADSGVAASAAG